MVKRLLKAFGFTCLLFGLTLLILFVGILIRVVGESLGYHNGESIGFLFIVMFIVSYYVVKVTEE